jgi:UDP-N-acetylglucosamine 1-carboxyvinyltransferase
MGGIAGGPVTVRGFAPRHLGLVLKKYELMGLNLDYAEDGVTVSRTRPIRPTDIQTLPFPGFPTDMQAQTMCLLALAQGSCVITENVFENRFMFASELQRMGADITIEGHHAIVHGVDHFSGAEVKAPDLRGGASLAMAGLVADGVSTITDIYHIERGYERFVKTPASWSPC